MYRKLIFKNFPIILMLIFFLSYCATFSSAVVSSTDSTVMVIYRVQIGSYTTENQAQDMVVKAQRDGLEPVRIDIISSLYKVRIGLYTDYTTAKQVATELGNRDYPGSFVVLIRLTSAEAAGLGLTPERSFYDEATSNVNLGSRRTEEELFVEATSTNDLTVAIQDYIELIIRYPQSAYLPTARYYTGYYYYRIGQDRNLALNTASDDSSRRYFESAVQVFRDFLTYHPDDQFAPSTQFWLAMTLYKLSRYGGELADKMAVAADEFKKVAINYPNSSIAADALMQYGGLLQELARNQRASYEQARTELTKIETLYPDASTTTRARAALIYAETYGFEGNWRASILAAETVINHFPDCRTDVALSYYLVALGYHKLGALRAAKEKYDFILANYADNQDNLIAYTYACSLFDQGIILFRLGENARAQSLINELKEKYPESIAAKLADQIRVP